MLQVLDKPSTLLGLLLSFVVGVYLGTAAQALTARALGDPMPIRAGWLRPSPKRQVSIFSAIAVLLVGWGWAEQTPMNDRWRARRFHVVTAVLVRPLVYALLALAVDALLGLAQRRALPRALRTDSPTSPSHDRTPVASQP